MTSELLLIISTIRFSNNYTISRIKKECGFRDEMYMHSLQIGVNCGIFNTDSVGKLNETHKIYLTSKGENLLCVIEKIIQLSI